MRAKRGFISLRHAFYLLEVQLPDKVRTLYVSRDIEDILGCRAEDFRIEQIIERIHREDRKRVLTAAELVKEGTEVEQSYRLRGKDGKLVPVKEYLIVIEKSESRFKVFGLLIIGQNLDCEFILQNIPDLIAVVDQRGFLKFSGESFKRVLGLSPDQVKGKKFLKKIHPAEREGFKRIINKVFPAPGQETYYTFRILDSSGKYQWVEALIGLPRTFHGSGTQVVVLSMRKISDRCELNWETTRSVNYDPLTDLPNRYLFTENLSEYLNLLKRKGEMAAILVVNIYRFREVNASYGMKVGDQILKQVADRLIKSLRKSDLVGRFMADEFCIGLLGIKTITGINVAVEKVKNTFRHPFVVNGNQIHIDVNIGVSTFPLDGEDAGDLIRKAEAALAKSREIGPGSIAYFSQDIEEEIMELTNIRNALGRAIENREIVPYYQPVFALDEGKIIGVEALARWENPDLGTLDPSKFISVAEETGLITDIGYCILNQAVRDISTLTGTGVNLFLGVNFSARQFTDENLPGNVKEILEAYSFPSQLFIMEITESTAMKEPERTREILRRMREMGVKIAIDDFGTGYSSLNYLLEFEVDKIKIDKTFVLQMLEKEKASRVVSTIISLSKSLGASSLAEGVENERILKKLVEFGCDEGQGFYFAKPMSFDKLREYVSERV